MHNDKPIRFEVRAGDFYESETLVNRSEVSGPEQTVAGVDLWNSYTFKLDPFVNTAEWMVLGQWHEGSVGLSRNPYISFILHGEQLSLRVKHYDPSDIPNGQSETIILYEEENFPRGEDIDVVMRHRVSETDGLLQVWLRGVLIADYSGPLGYWAEENGPYWRFGIYRNTVTDTAVATYRNMLLRELPAGSPNPFD